MLKKAIYFAVIFCTIFFTNITKAEGACRYANGFPIRWYESEITICVRQSASHLPEIKNIAMEAASLWSSIPESPRLRFSNQESDCKISLGMGSSPRGLPIEPLATNTAFNFPYGKIDHSEIVLNKIYDGQFGDASTSNFYYDLRSIVYHEVGHALGLEEEFSDTRSIMYLTFFKGSTIKRELTITDVRSVVGLYGKPDLK